MDIQALVAKVGAGGYTPSTQEAHALHEYDEQCMQEAIHQHEAAAPLDRANAARLKAALDKRYRFDCGVMTLGQFLASKDLHRRSHYIRHYERHKRLGCYARLRTPAHEYTLWYQDADGREAGMDVPKMIYDTYQLPEKTREEAH